MNIDEFINKFRPCLAACYPMVYSWFQKQSEDVHAKWVEELWSVDCQRACDLLNLWYRDNKHPWRGEVEDMQMIPVYVRQALANLASDGESIKRYSRKDYRKPQALVSMKESLVEMLKLPRDQWREFAEAKYPVDHNDKRNWKKCKLCVDTGLVEVWHLSSLKEIDQTQQCERPVMAVMTCGNCNARIENKLAGIEIFNPQKFCKWTAGDVPEALEWMRASKSERICMATGKKAIEEYAEFA